MVVAHQTFGDTLRWNPHFHAIVLEGGFDDVGTFVHSPFSGLQSMSGGFPPAGKTGVTWSKVDGLHLASPLIVLPRILY